MADWTTISNAALDVGAPPRSVDALALRDNPIAIVEGRPGAPRISPWATVESVSAGDTVRYSDPGRRNVIHPLVPGVFETAFSATVLASGTIRVKWDSIRPTDGTLTSKCVRVRGTTVADQGSDVSHSSGSGSSSVTTTRDVTVEPGDAIQIYARFSSGDAAASRGAVDDFTIGTTGGYLWVLGGGSLVLSSEPT